jgi:hypothetical protein
VNAAGRRESEVREEARNRDRGERCRASVSTSTDDRPWRLPPPYRILIAGGMPMRSTANLLPLGAILLSLLAAAPAAAADVGNGECRLATDGVLICAAMDIRGQLREAPQILVGRESLDPRLQDLRESFLDEIESTVRNDPF